MKRQHGRTGPRVVSAWTALWVGVLLILSASTISYLVGVNQNAVVTEQNVIGSSEVLCPHREDLAISWQGAQRSHADTVQFMQACGWIETVTPIR